MLRYFSNIPEIGRKIKERATGELFIVFLILLVGIVSFGLGRLSAHEEGRAPIEIRTLSGQGAAALRAAAEDPVSPNTSATEAGLPAASPAQAGNFVASKNGTKYHFPWCPGAQQIKESNKIYFATKEEAEKAGYTPAANCKGL